jgi:chromosome partitioning protein
MKILAVAMTKGGVGKTTTAVNLSHGLALRGHRVLLVDADTQGQCAKALGVETDVTLTEVLEGAAPALDALTRAREYLDLIPSNHHLSRAALTIARREHDGHRVLAEALAPVLERYEYVVIDAAPGFDAIAVNVLGCAHDVIAPAALTPAALAGVLDFVRHIETVKRHNTALNLRFLLPTFLDLRIRQSGEMLHQLQEHFGTRMCKPIRVNVDLAEAFGYQQSIFEYAPRSRGADDYERFITRVLTEAPSPQAAQRLGEPVS